MKSKSKRKSEFHHSTTSTIEERSLRGSKYCSGVHTIVIATEENYLTQWQVVYCRVNVEGVTGTLAKSQAHTQRAQVRLEEKSEGEVILPTAQIGYLSRIGTVLS